MFTRKKTRERYSWRSRVLFKAFPDLDTARTYLSADPLWQWPKSSSFTLPESLPPNGEAWLLLFQVTDVWLSADRSLVDILETYLRKYSDLLAFIGRYDVLPKIRKGGN